MSTFQDPFAGLVRGILQGAQVRAQLQRTQDEHDAMQRQALQQARENRIQDIQQQMISRPVQNGTVTEQSPSSNVELGGVSMPMQPITYTRPADKSRTVKYKDQDGNEFQREIMTPLEQVQQQAQIDQVIARAKGQLYDVDPETPVGKFLGLSQKTTIPTTALPQLYRPLVSQESNVNTNATREDAIAAANDRNDANITAKSAPKVTRTYTDNQNQTVGVFSDGSTKVLGPALVKPAGRAGGSGLTPNAQAVQNRFQQRQQELDQTSVDKMQQQEQALHAQRSTLGDAISAADGATIPDPLYTGKGKAPTITVNPLYRSTWKNKLDAATNQVAGLQASQTRLINKWGGQSGAPKQNTPAGTPAAPKTASAAQVQAFAKANNMSVDQATQLVKKQGYTVQ